MVSKSSPPFRRCQMCVCQESVVRLGPKKELYSLQTSKGFGLCFLNHTPNIPKRCVKWYLERLGINVFKFTYICFLYFLHTTTRWAPSYKRSYNHYKWPYKWDLQWVTGVVTLLIGLITPYITGWGPPCIYAIFVVDVFTGGFTTIVKPKMGRFWRWKYPGLPWLGRRQAGHLPGRQGLANQPESRVLEKKT